MKIKQLTHSLTAKIVAYFLLVITASITLACVVGAYFIVEENFYTRGENQIKRESLYYMARSDGLTALYNVLNGNEQYALSHFENTNFRYEVFGDNGEKLSGNYQNVPTELSFEFVFDRDETGGLSSPGTESYTVKAYIDDEFPVSDQYSAANELLGLAYSLRYLVFVIGIAGAILAIACFVFLMCSAGHKQGQDEITAGGLVKMPFDLLTGALFLTGFVAVAFFFDNAIYNDYAEAIALGAGFILAVVIGTAYCMNFAVRVKLGGWWKNTVIYRLLLLLLRICKALWRGIVTLANNLPLIWKTLLLLAGISLLELLSFGAFWWDTSVLLFAWVLEKAVVIPAVLYLALVLRQLQKGGEALAVGDLSYQVDTKRMFWDFKRHGENLNGIAEGMTHAVDERVKSERFKTELITNVSHDIKTPLTSIINYADLIGKEQTENGKIAEYTQVLLRQAERLKKLIEDLVDASKASTGNIDVLLAPCEAGVLLTQAVGEYEQRLRDGNLELIVKQPETPVKILADGRLMWRVFDNLMNNICKYAQGGTRVYLTIEVKNGAAVISFKNTSRYPLDIPPEELMERFVRGDSSRSTEGNGLGLSIAESLTELQNGKLELSVDGDLFKVTLSFNTIR